MENKAQEMKSMEFSKFNIKPFDGENFNLWKWQMETFFANAGLLKVVKGEEQSVNVDHKNKVNLVFAQALAPSQLLHIISINEPAKQWEKLCTIYEQAASDTVQQLSAQFFAMKLGEDEDISSFISKMSNTVNRLKDLGETIKDSMVIANIVEKLPEKYSSFIVAWESSPVSERTLANLTSRLLRQEARIKMTEPQRMLHSK